MVQPGRERPFPPLVLFLRCLPCLRSVRWGRSVRSGRRRDLSRLSLRFLPRVRFLLSRLCLPLALTALMAR